MAGVEMTTDRGARRDVQIGDKVQSLNKGKSCIFVLAVLPNGKLRAGKRGQPTRTINPRHWWRIVEPLAELACGAPAAGGQGGSR
jgi:hypothetical protein